MSLRRIVAGDPVVALVFGTVTFLLVFGVGILNPQNIAWLATGDPATYYLSWLFYRQSPWTLPPGANPDYGLELGSSMFYSDGIPLVAIAAKVVAPWLPAVFQYDGLWLLLCFILQAFFALKLTQLITPHRGVVCLSTGFFLFAPPFLWRGTVHFALAAHWIILAALYLCLRPVDGSRRLFWPLLAALSAGIHSYLFAMVLMLWTADVARRGLLRAFTVRALVGEVAIVLAGSIFVLWLAGFFMVTHGLGADSQNFARMNLLSPINPNNSNDLTDWSYFLPSLSPPYSKLNYEFEGFNFFGAGFLVLVLVAAIRALLDRDRPRLDRQWLPLAALALGLLIFSLSHRIGWGSALIFHYPLPKALPLGLLRACGRLFWPVFYLALFFTIRHLFTRFGPQRTLLILGLCFALQALDTSSGWLQVHRNMNKTAGPVWPTPLQSDFWTQAAARYHKIYLYPEPDPQAELPYAVFAYYAALHGLPTDAAYLARTDERKATALLARQHEELRSGKYDPTALYVLNDEGAALAELSHDPQADLCAKVDGFNVLAPGWKK